MRQFFMNPITLNRSKRVCIFLALAVISVTPLFSLYAQPVPAKPLSSIIIVGNEHTDAEIIKRELLFNVGEVLSDSLLSESKNRLENLWLFNRVEFFPLPDNDSVSLLISVTERLYIFPFPEFRFEDRDLKKITYGFGFAHNNFRGRNEKLYVSMLFGERPGYQFTYFNPWVNRKLHLTTGLYLKKFIKGNRSLPFDENHLYFAATFGKYWTRDLYSRITFIHDRINVAENYSYLMETGNKEETDYRLRFSTVFDSRDLYAYPSDGWYSNLRLTKSGLFNSKIDYFQYLFDVRKYESWNDFVFGLRLFTRQSLGELPIYNRVYFGYNERVRGYFSQVFEGRHSFLSSVAFRFPILKKRYFNFPSSILPSYTTQNLKFGINGGLFADTGIVWDKRKQFARNNFISGFGAGLHFLLPYIEVLRMDVAFNEQFEREFIMEIGMAF